MRRLKKSSQKKKRKKVPLEFYTSIFSHSQEGYARAGVASEQLMRDAEKSSRSVARDSDGPLTPQPPSWLPSWF